MLLLALLIGCTSPPDPEPVRRGGGYTRLSETGLYADFAARTVSPGIESFAPRYPLWSDGAHKTRWLELPPGGHIDATDPDRWTFPVGTRAFKQFAAPDGRLLETRLIERIAATGDPERDYWMGSFAWNDDESDAVLVTEGAENVRGTQHDVPGVDACHFCHNGEPGRMLGVSALQLAGPGDGVRLADLVAHEAVAPPPAEPAVPGDPVTAQALGYLHTNCGQCHNPEGNARPDTDLDLRVRATDRTVDDTGAFRTAVGVDLFRFKRAEVTKRVAPGDPDHSAVVVRMSTREERQRMPPIASEVVDETGLAAVRAWIASLPVPP